MSRLQQIVEELEKVYHLHVLYEMTNVPPSVHKLSFDSKIHVLQPGDMQLEHGPRVKVFRKKNLSDAYVINLHKDADKIDFEEKPDKHWLNAKKRAEVLGHIKKYRAAYLEMWNDPTMSTDELRARMDKIDRNSK